MKKSILFVLTLLFSAVLLLAQSSSDSLFCVAVIQLESLDVGDFNKMNEFAKKAQKEDADLIVFPESSVFGWLNPDVFTKALPIPGMYSDAFADIAIQNNIWVAAGITERGSKLSSDTNIYEVYDAGILINPKGDIVLHHRKYNVLKNSFDKCPSVFGSGGCSYTSGELDDIKTAQTPFGETAILVCADAYTYDTTALSVLKAQKPQFVIIPWGIAAGKQDECGSQYFNATNYAAAAAKFLETAYVIGSNAVGVRSYGRFRPSWYCGTSGYATPSGEIGGIADTETNLNYFYIPLRKQ